MAFFVISSMVLGLLSQLQIFAQFCLVELLVLSTGLELLELSHLTYPRLLTGFCMLVFFTKLSLMEFQNLVLFFPFSVIDRFELLWMGSFHKNTYIFVLYINDLPDDVVFDLLSMLIIPLSILSVIRHLICGNN